MLQADRIIVKDNSYLEVRYTSVPINGNWHTGGITSLLIDDFSELTFLDGTTDLISIYDRATATLKGGSINMIRSFQFVGSVGHIDLECQEGWSWVYNSGQIKGITGLWENNTPFDIEFLDQGSGYAPVWQNINVIPEPVTLVLFGLGGLLIRRKRYADSKFFAGYRELRERQIKYFCRNIYTRIQKESMGTKCLT